MARGFRVPWVAAALLLSPAAWVAAAEDDPAPPPPAAAAAPAAAASDDADAAPPLAAPAAASSSASPADADAAAMLQADDSENPVRRVLNVLHGMTKKVEHHAKEEDELFERFMCYCRTSGNGLLKSIAEAKDKMPQLIASVQEASSSSQQLESDIVENKAGRQAAEQAMAETQEMRKGEKARFGAESTELKGNIDSIKKAIQALKAVKVGPAQGASLVQKSVLQRVRGLAMTVNPDRLPPVDRDALSALLQDLDMDQDESSGGETTADVGEITGILKQMLESMQGDLYKLVAQDEASHAQVDALEEAKRKEISTLTRAIEEKMDRLSATRVEIVQLKSDLESTRSGLDNDQKLQADLLHECDNRKAEHVAIEKQLSAELVAITEAIKVLGSDKAGDMFKNAGAASFLQVGEDVQGADKEAAEQAARMLKALSAGNPSSSLGFLASRAAAIASKTAATHKHAGSAAAPRVGFAKIAHLVDQMLSLLKKEQEDDDLQQQMCSGELAREGYHRKELVEGIAAKEAELAAQEGQHQAVTKDTEMLQKSVMELDASVKEATLQRQEAHAHFVKVLTDTNAAVEMLRLARAHLEKFYGKAALIEQKRRKEQTEAQATVNDEYGFLDSSPSASASDSASPSRAGAAPSGGAAASLASTGARAKPAAGDGAAAVLQLIKNIEDKMKGEAEEAKQDEAKEQQEYERYLAKSALKRESDVKALADRAATLAEVAEGIRVLDKKGKALRGELKQTEAVIASLHKECDWLMAHYSERKQDRVGEAEALKKTQAVLAGASYSLAQGKKVRRHVQQLPAPAPPAAQQQQ